METMRPTPRSAWNPLDILSHICDLCNERISGSAYYFADAGKDGEPPSAWMLCATCSGLVTRQFDRVRQDSPMRLRIALGVVASERGVAPTTSTRRGQSDDMGFNRLLVAVVWLAFIVHAAAFILIVAVIATSH